MIGQFLTFAASSTTITAHCRPHIKWRLNGHGLIAHQCSQRLNSGKPLGTGRLWVAVNHSLVKAWALIELLSLLNAVSVAARPLIPLMLLSVLIIPHIFQILFASILTINM